MLPLIIFGFLGYLIPLKAEAASVTDTITISVGYFGGPYFEKATYNWKELDDNFGGALDTHETAYSFNSGSRTAVDSARGFYLSDLLEYAGVDLNSAASLSFYTKDQDVGAFATFPKSALLDEERYFFPNLSMNTDKQLVPLNGGDLTDGAVRVATMLALEDYWEWDAVDSNFTNLSPASRFRLVFGQTDPTEKRTSQSAKYVHTIYVTFAGAPVMATDHDNLALKVGSSYQVPVKLGTADPVLDQSLSGSFTWSSSDTSVVTVDKGGSLTAVSKGTAVITVTSGKTSMSVTVAVSDDSKTAGGKGAGSGTGSGIGTGSGTGTGPGVSQPAGGSGQAGNNKPSSNVSSAAVSEAPAAAIIDTSPSPPPDTSGDIEISEQTPSAYILSGDLMSQAEYASWIKSILGEPSDSSGGSLGGGMTMSEDTTQLVLKQQDTPLVAPLVIGSASFLLLLGAAYGFIKFKHQLKR